MKVDTESDELLSEIFQLRYDNSDLNEERYTEHLLAIILDAWPVEKYSIRKHQAVPDPDLRCTRFKYDKTILTSYSEKFSTTGSWGWKSLETSSMT